MEYLIEIINELQSCHEMDKVDIKRKEVIMQYLISINAEIVEDTDCVDENNQSISLTNIIVPVRPYNSTENIKYLGVACHYDAYPGSQGANDNGSSVAALIDLISRFKEDPLEKIGLMFFFFDKEESRCIGSKSYVRRNGIDSLIGMYNMEMVGLGDILAVWGFGEERRGKYGLMEAIDTSSNANGVQAIKIPEVVMHNSDHYAFMKNGIEAFSLTTVTLADVQAYQKYREASQNSDIKAKQRFWREIMRKQAPVFKHYHQPTDLVEHLNEGTLRKISDIIYDAARSIECNL